jgi:NitT/TauT family transport system ATP-binding protein
VTLLIRSGQPARSVIQICGLSLVYQSRSGTVPALHNVNLDAREGEFVCVVGPSGCGKSSMLKLIAGLLRPTVGTARVNGFEVRAPTADIGIVFQSPILMAWRSVIDNILLQIEIRHGDVKAYRPLARDLIELVGLKGFEDAYPFQLSGGMQQRAALCRALIHDPSLLLMDEPFGALDALTREQMNLELQRIWMEKKKTVLFITHSIAEAVLLADRVLAMSARPGRILCDIPVSLPRPRTLQIMSHPDFTRIVDEVRGYLTSTLTA